MQRKNLRSFHRLCEAAKAPDDFLNAAKLILLVDVRGEDDFRRRNVGHDLSYKGPPSRCEGGAPEKAKADPSDFVLAPKAA